MTNKRLFSWLIVLAILLVIVIFALWLRVALPYNQVFVGSWVKMTGIDAYYYMRLVDNLVRNFPNLTEFDPYMQFPGGSGTGGAPDFFAYLMGGIIWLIGLGKPDQHMVDVIGVYIPPVLAALTIVAVFFIGKMLGSKWLGLLAAGLLAIMPGEFLNRSLLGYTDHHIAEVLFSTGMMMFVFMALKESEGKGLVEMVKGGWKGIGRPVVYGALGGIFLGLYMLTWAGAMMFVLVMFVFIVVQVVMHHMNGRRSDYLGLVGVSVFVVALLEYAPWSRGVMELLSLVIGAVATGVLVVLSGIMLRRGTRRIYYPLSVVAMGLAGMLGVYIISPVMLTAMFAYIKIILFTWQTTTTVMEMQPLLIQQGNFTLQIALGNFLLGFLFSLVAIGVLVYQVIKKGEANKVLLLIWSLVMLLAALAMRRFAYYYAVNVALLTGYICWIPLSLLVNRKKIVSPLPAHKGASAKSRRKAARQEKPAAKKSAVAIALVLAAIILIVYYPNIGPLPDGQKPAVDLASRPLFAPSNAWCESLDWLRANTDQPLGKPDTYYGLYKSPGKAGGFDYPASSYGVLAWWDYGYWITRIGRHIPCSNPGTGERGEPYYFTAQDEASAARVINNWGAHYVIVDKDIASFDGKFHALATLSRSSYSAFYDLFLQKQGNRYIQVFLFYPEYYRSMVTRLYNFDGKSVIPDVVNVVGYYEISGPDGKRYKELVETKKFNSYEEAQRFINENKGQNYFIAGEDPYKSPVPLDGLKNYKFIYGSSQKTAGGAKSQSNIKIFEYKRDVVPLVGDWNGDKKTELGLWQPEGYFVLDKNGDGQLVKLGPFGYSTDVPISGDWNGDGKSEIGVWRPSDFCFYLDFNGDGIWNPDKGDKKLGPFGQNFRDIPIIGDWNGDGKDEVGIYTSYSADKPYFFLNIAGDGLWDSKSSTVKLGPFGRLGDIAVAGDWNADGKAEIGVWEPDSQYFLLDYTGDGKWDPAKEDQKLGPYGDSYDTPLSGRWDGKNKDEIGVWDPGTRLFHLNISGDGKWGDDSSNIKLNPFDGL